MNDAITSFPGRQFTSSEAADYFAAKRFDEPRLVEKIDGRWVGRDFIGEFRLVDGRNCYAIRYSHATELWSIYLEPQED